ncbi:hypothetical protein M9H77_21903 [Catharanthus roseus]|uniref:Uncharacterized protein n=1 Tax=Catharanthus roseus TaxID=4058 RepID=A0ACC0AQE9_CATRO|nr:hypothetical protein M9H77_21903 [Catharanthus roseus]
MVVGGLIRMIGIAFHVLRIILDPWFKFEYMKWVTERMYPRNLNLVDKLREDVYALFEEYKKLNTSQESHGRTSPLPSSSSITSSSCSIDLIQDSVLTYRIPYRDLKIPGMSKWWPTAVIIFFFS